MDLRMKSLSMTADLQDRLLNLVFVPANLENIPSIVIIDA